MKTKRNHALVASCMIVALSAVSSHAALTIGFAPTNQTVPLGSNPQVDIVATFDAIPSPSERLGGYDLIVSYNVASLISFISFSSVSFGTALGNSSPSYISGPGQVRLIDISLDSPVPAQPLSFTLATLTFSADIVGVSDLALSLGQGGLTTGGTTDPVVRPQQITGAVLNPGRITVRQPSQGVPEGGNLAVVALPTLLGLMFLSKRMKQAKH